MIEPRPRPYHTGRFADRIKSVNATLSNFRPADWTEPKYPGDAILRVDLVRGDEFGGIRVQWGFKDDQLKVGAFLPGVEECPPGDTPKVWPEKSEMVADKAAASKAVVRYLVEAIRDGWRVQ